MGTILDLIIGDPHNFPHPIRAIGNLIARLEKRLLGEVTGNPNRNPYLEKTKGILLWSLVVTITVALTAAVTIGAYAIHPYIGILVEAILTCYILAAKSLYKESMAVTKELDKGDLDKARYALSMIVGRDTDVLNPEEVAKAVADIQQNLTNVTDHFFRGKELVLFKNILLFEPRLIFINRIDKR